MLIDAGPGRNQPAAAIHNFLGHDGTSPEELRREAWAQLSEYPTVNVVDGRVTGITHQDRPFLVQLDGNRSVRGRR